MPQINSAEYDIEDIWERVKNYVNPNEVRASSKEEAIQKLERAMQNAPKTRKKGNLKNLIKAGFAKEALENERIKMELLKFPTTKVKEEKAGGREFADLGFYGFKTKQERQITIIPKSRTHGTRQFKTSNLRFKNTTWRGKKAVFVFNKKGRTITWRLI